MVCATLISTSACASKTNSNNQISNTITNISKNESTTKQINYLMYKNTSFDKSLASAKVTLGEYKNIELEVNLPPLTPYVVEVGASVSSEYALFIRSYNSSTACLITQVVPS